MDQFAGAHSSIPPEQKDPHRSSERQHSLIERRHLVDEVKKHFARFSDAHGAITEHALLLGQQGVGKTHIAKQAAQEVAASQGRRVLAVTCTSYNSFVTDYYDAYQQITGDTIPFGLTLPCALSKIQCTLESRRQEWILLLINIRPCMEELFALGSLPCLPYVLSNFIPNRGHIISTSNDFIELTEKNGTKKYLPLTRFLKAAKVVTVTSMESETIKEYARIHHPLMQNIPSKFIEWCTRTDRNNLLLLNLTATNLRLLQVDWPTYFNILRDEIGPSGTSIRKRSQQDRLLYNVTLRIMWNALADRSQWAIRVLSAMSLVYHTSTSIPLLQMLPIFQNSLENTLRPAIDLLLALGLVSIQGDIDLDGSLSMPLRVWEWVNVLVTEKHNDNSTCADLMLDWIDVFNAIMGTPSYSGKYNITTYWKHFRDYDCVISTISSHKFSSAASFCFLVKVAEVIANESQVGSWAIGIVNTANQLWLRLRIEHPPAVQEELQVMYFRLRKLQTQLSLSRQVASLAESDLRSAQLALGKLGDEPSASLRREMELVEIRVLTSRQHLSVAEELLYAIIADPEPGITSSTIAKRHVQLSNILRQQGLEISALCHTHEAMRHWMTWPEEEQWSLSNLKIPDSHAITLMQVQKYSGALIWLPRLLDRWCELIPYSSLTVWRLGELLVRAYTRKDMVRAAEDVVVRMLEREGFDELVGDECITHCLGLLYEVAVLYMHHSRLIESEAILRFVITNATSGKIKKFFGSDDKCPEEWWQELIVCLLMQGKEAAEGKVTDDYIERGYDSLSLLSRTIKVGRIYKKSAEWYQLAIWAEEEGRLREWKSLLAESERSVAGYRLAVRGFAHPRQRVQDSPTKLPDFEADIDLHRLKMAKKSRILHLLGCDLIYLWYADKAEVENWDVDLDPLNNDAESTSPKPHDLKLTLRNWSTPSQRVLGEFWKWCNCRRKRLRSASVNPIDIIDKQFMTQADKQEDRKKREGKYTQKKLTDYYTDYRLIRRTACAREGCPCIEGNKRAAIEYAEYEKTLFAWKDPRRKKNALNDKDSGSSNGQNQNQNQTQNQNPNNTNINRLARSFHPRYKPSKSRVRAFTSSEQFAEEDRAIWIRTGPHRDCYDPTLRPGSFHWRWMQSEFEYGEREDECYVLRGALEVPSVIITTVEGEEDRILNPGGNRQVGVVGGWFQVDWTVSRWWRERNPKRNPERGESRKRTMGRMERELEVMRRVREEEEEEDVEYLGGDGGGLARVSTGVGVLSC